MNRIDAAFAGLREQGQGGLMPFVCAGSPTPGALESVLPALSDAGAAVIEVGIPFSDPIADGPVIAAAMHHAIESGVTPTEVLRQVASVRDRVESGIVAMISVSLVHAFGGPSQFASTVREAGFDGCIFPDAPLEESEELAGACEDAGLTCSLLVAPTTPAERAAAIAKRCTGFVYLLARAGITGERSEAPDIEAPVRAIRASTKTPIACGFGIGTAEHVQAVVAHADAAIVGSALVKRLVAAHEAGESVSGAAEEFMIELSTGLIAGRA